MLNIDTLKGPYTNEQVLVILLTRLYFGTQKIDDIRDFLDNEIVDWNVFYKLISVNDIRGFICEVITISQITIDQETHDRLKKDAMGITLVAANLAGLKNHLMIEFEKLGIKAVPYKGATLATRYYKSPLLRESSDLDFLVNRDEVPQLMKCLYENGYRSKFNISAHQMGFVMRFHRELSFQSPKNRMGISCGVELQWRLLENFFRQFHQHDFFVEYLQSYTAIDGSSHIGLAPTYDFLAVASHHLIREPLLKFKYLIDLACMVQTSSSQLDWEEINLQFKLHNFSGLLNSGMNALAEIVGLQLPVLNTVSPAYHLFSATEIKTGRNVYFRKIKLVNLKQSFLEKIKLSLKAHLSLLIPNLNDLSMTKAPAWTIPLIIPVKSLRFLYLYLTKRP
ncbi:nucleotidyltransferase family protein [Pedobacter sp. ok626]|uniref:nucleotidyltransferase family protein n=1 Tax=Pedobacter sp. ok626 TaxID=1761882 RepID=UPI001404637C|nr:nucleotidyltransferase family protein [Pedobacter sp. ok626]